MTAGQSRPSLAEIAVGLTGMALVGFGGAVTLLRSGLAPATLGLVLSAWSGIAGLAGFAAAWLLHRPPVSTFGVRRVTGRWLLLSIAAGLLAFVAKGLVVLLATAAVDPPANPQDIYAAGGAGGTISLILATLFLGFLTPVGEELLFRGVVTNGLLRFGKWTGVIGGALVFALAHGINLISPVAFLLGLIAGELMRRSGSVWPSATAHIVYNLPTIPVMVWAQAA